MGRKLVGICFISLLIGCGGNSSSKSSAAAGASPVTSGSSAPVAFRTLDKGDLTDLVNQPVADWTSRVANDDQELAAWMLGRRR